MRNQTISQNWIQLMGHIGPFALLWLLLVSGSTTLSNMGLLSWFSSCLVGVVLGAVVGSLRLPGSLALTSGSKGLLALRVMMAAGLGGFSALIGVCNSHNGPVAWLYQAFTNMA